MVDSTASIVDEWIDSINEKREPDGCFHPSSMWSCSRQAVMSARGEQQTNPPDAQTMRVFRVGSVLHQEFQAALISKFGDAFTPEIEIEMARLAGHADGLLMADGDIDGSYVVYELKTIRSLINLRKEGKPQEAHVKQAATYAVALKRMGYNVTEVRIVYFEKTNLDIQEYIIPYRVEWEKMVDDRIAELAPYMDKPGTHPACDGPKWLYKYCAFNPSCGSSVVYGDGPGATPLPKKEKVTFEW